MTRWKADPPDHPKSGQVLKMRELGDLPADRRRRLEAQAAALDAEPAFPYLGPIEVIKVRKWKDIPPEQRQETEVSKAAHDAQPCKLPPMQCTWCMLRYMSRDKE